jgi:hypothetical protein
MGDEVEDQSEQPPPQPDDYTAQRIQTFTGIPDELRTAVAAYRTNYAAYTVAQDPAVKAAYKTASDNAMAAINTIIANASAASNANTSYIQNFIASYQNTTGDIGELQAQSQAIRREGPALQNTLAQTQQLHSRAVAAADETSLYVKAGIVFGLLIAAGIVGSL